MKPPATTFNEFYDISGPPKPPTDSWWIGKTREEFAAQAAIELHRMRGSKENNQIHPKTLGGVLL